MDIKDCKAIQLTEITIVPPKKQYYFNINFSEKNPEIYGKLFILIEVPTPESLQYSHYFNNLITKFKHKYYNSNFSNNNLTSNFEQTIKHLNNEIINDIKNDTITLDIQYFNILIGLIYPSLQLDTYHLDFSYTGTLNPLLIHKLKINKYTSVNISKNNKNDEQQKKNIHTIFSHIISGEFPKQDYLFICNNNLINYLSHNELIKTLTTLTPEQSANKIKTFLENIRQKTFIATLISIKPKEEKDELIIKQPLFETQEQSQKQKKEPASIAKKSQKADESLVNLIQNKDKINKIITPDLISHVTSFINKAKSFCKKSFVLTKKTYNITCDKIKKVKNHPKLHKNQNNKKLILNKQKKDPQDYYDNPKQNEKQKFEHKITNIEKQKNKKSKNNNDFKQNLSIYCKNIIKRLSKLGKKILKNFMILGTNTYKTAFQKFQKLPKVNLIITLTIILAIIICGFSISRVNKINSKKQALKKYNSLTQETQNQINIAEAKIIYNEEQKALDIINKIKKRLKVNFNTNNEKEKKFVKKTKEKINQLLNQIHNLKNIKDPHLLVNFAPFGQNIIITDSLLYNDYIINIDNNNKKIYLYNLINDEIQKINYSSYNIPALKLTKQIHKKPLLLTVTDELYELDIAGLSLKKINFKKPKYSNIVDMTGYNTRLYILDIGTDQIYKYNKNSYTKFSKWITDGTSINNANSFAIDGNIIVLENKKYSIFSRGKLVNTKFLNYIYPEISQSTNLYTTPDSKKLYFIDPKTNKSIIITKKNILIKQFQSPKFDNLQNLIIDENKNKQYLTNNSKIYTIDF